MDDYPTEEELAEYEGLAMLPSTQPAQQTQSHNVETPAISTLSSSLRATHSFFENNSQLSQIPAENAVNRRLFGSPMPTISNLSNRMSSTPFTSHKNDPSNDRPQRIDVEEFSENNYPIENIDLNPRKRRLDDLFGDIADIADDDDFGQVYYGYDTEENAKKKARSEEQIDRELIERILSARAANRAKTSNFMKQSKLEQLQTLQKYKLRNLSESYPNWPCIPVTGEGSCRIYVRMHSEEFELNQLNELSLRKNFSNLLGDSSENIWNEAQAIVQKRMIAPATPITSISEDMNEIVMVMEICPASCGGKLWVEKYRPKGYLDLLSDESTNRSLLTWLKMWDKMVFNRQFKKEDNLSDTQKYSASNFNKRTGKFEVGGVRYRKNRQSDLKTEIDSFGRPIQKIAVLCGPPGLGKTTLAHTIARHAGYAVREINASDDRSPESFRLALQNGTEMQTTLLNQERRPNCIILDEIDGAPIASIEFLLRFVNDQAKDPNKPKANDKVGSKPSKSKTSGILRRPIICICNDIYTPSLRPLRQMAFIVTFPPLESSRLAERLLTIARRERLKTDMTTLLALVEKSGNDVRSCISVLQFYANSQKPLTLLDVMKSNVGQKDKQKGLFDIWSAVFQMQRPKQGAQTETKASDARTVMLNNTIRAPTEVDNTLRSRVDCVLNVVHMGGDHERLINGVYENYLTQKMPDGNFHGITEATEWFCFSDCLQTYIQSHQNYAVYPYLQYGYAVWHILFSSLAWPKIVFPTKSYEFHQKLSVQKAICAAFIKNISVIIRSLGNSSTIISDAIATIRQIICPSLRSVSLQLLTPKERSDLQHTVEVMADLGLMFTQLKNLDGTYQYQIEPDINSLCNFKATQRSNELTYSNMQIIAREVELEVMRRSAPRQSTEKVAPKNSKSKILQGANKPNHLQKLIPKPMNAVKSKTKDLVTKDFFGRITEKKVALSVQEGGSDLIVKSPIWYRYKEGFNNAVRKDVSLKSLL